MSARAARAAAALMLAAATLLLHASCGEDVVQVELSLADEPRGFLCVDGQDRQLLARAIDAMAACAVVDFIRFAGTPSCRVSELVDTCCEGGCDTLLARKQVPLDVAAIQARCSTDADDAPCLVDAVRDALRGLTWSDAPSGFVSVRLTITATACVRKDADGDDTSRVGSYPAFDPEALVGCAFSCPADLAIQETPLVIDLDVVDEHCEPNVRACATLSPKSLGCGG